MAARGPFHVLEAIRGGGQSLSRARDDATQETVLLKTVHQRPSGSGRGSAQHEFNLLSDARLAAAAGAPERHVIRALALDAEPPVYRLVLQDPGEGTTTLAALLERERYNAGQLTAARKIAIALALATALDSVHAAGLVHLSVKPSSVLVGSAAHFAAAASASDPALVWLVDFESACRLPLSASPGSGGTLVPAYIAPEQTGRVTERVDARTDLYSLGVVLYEMFTLQLPFALDPTSVEWVHAHLARAATLASELDPSIPHVVSAVIEKLMAKEKRLRYQSATSLKSDLTRIQTSLAVAGVTGLAKLQLTLGESDNASFFQMPAQLFGRDLESSMLQHLFVTCRDEKTHRGAAICGEAGSGKTALIGSFHRRLFEHSPGFWFAQGTCDENKRTPLAVVTQVVACLVECIVAQGDATVELVRGNLKDAISPAAVAYLCSVVPSCRPLFDGVEEIAGVEAHLIHKVLYPALRKLFSTIAASRPLILVFEDLQWSDHASLDILDMLIQDTSDELIMDQSSVLVLVSYRDDEDTIARNEGLAALAKKFEQDPTAFSFVRLGDLKYADVAALTGALLRRAPAECTTLIDLCINHTNGNPFLVCAFFQALMEDAVVVYDHEAKHFVWNDDQIVRYSSTLPTSPGSMANKQILSGRMLNAAQRSSIAKMTQRRLDSLAPDVRNVLGTAAVIGLTFSFDTLVAVIGEEPNVLRVLLNEAVEAGVIEQIAGREVWVPDSGRPRAGSEPAQQPSGDRYRFMHEKVQELCTLYKSRGSPPAPATPTIISTTQTDGQVPRRSSSNMPRFTSRSAAHLAVAQYYVAHGAMDEGTPVAAKFDTLTHFNHALRDPDLEISAELARDIARYNRDGIGLAKAATSFDMARTYSLAARDALRRYAAVTNDGRSSWELDYDLTSDIYSACIDLNDEDDQIADEALKEAATHAQKVHEGEELDDHAAQRLTDQVNLISHKIARLCITAHHDEAMKWGKRALEMIGEGFPPTQAATDAEVEALTQEMTSLAEGRDFESCMDAPLSGNQAYLRAVGKLYAHILNSALASFPQYIPIISNRCVVLCYKNGFYPEMAPVMVVHASRLAERGRFNDAHRLSSVAVAVEKKYKIVGEGEIQSCALVAPYIRPLEECTRRLEACYDRAKTFGERGPAGFAAFTIVMQLYVAGSALPVLSSTPLLHDMLNFVVLARNSTALGHLSAMVRAAYETVYGVEWHSRVQTDFGPRISQHISTARTADFYAKLPCDWSRSTFGTFHALSLLLANQNEAALDYATKAVALLAKIPGSVTSVAAVFVNAMALARMPAAAEDGEEGKAQETKHLEALDDLVKQLSKWADASPTNYGGLYHLALGEQLRRTAKKEEALAAFDVGLTQCMEARMWYGVSLAHSCMARLWESATVRVGKSMYSTLHLVEYARATREWGCLSESVVVDDTLAVKDATQDSNEPDYNAQLDALSLLKASRVISSELNLERLLSILMAILMESAGAQHACVLRPTNNDRFVIEAASSVATKSAPPFASLATGTVVSATDVPLHIINLAISLEELVVVADARKDIRFLDDPYIIATSPLSVACAPLMTHGKLLRVVLVQNNVVANAFPFERVAVFKSLLSQAGVSIENALLYQERDDAVRANKSKSAFLATVSHEIRTPMNGIMNMTALLSEAKLPPDVMENVEIIKSAGQTLLHLIESILDVGKLEAGQLQVDVTDVDVPLVISSTVKTIKTAAELKQLALNLTVEPSVPQFLRGDAVRLRQILTNLVSNAVKFTERGSVSVNVSYSDQGSDNRTGRPSELGSELLIGVTDTGIGISEADSEKLFRAFTQADSSSTRRYEGAGLGLTISKNLARMMGGDVWFTSKPGQGSTFYCALKFPRCTDTAAGGSSLGLIGHAPPEKTVRTLIVDDNKINQRVLQKILEKLGVPTEVANDGAEAVERVSTAGQPYQLVLMDIFMPNMDGIEATQRIRALENVTQPYIVAVTASAMAGDRERFISAGMQDYLPKPVTAESLKRVVAAARHPLPTSPPGPVRPSPLGVTTNSDNDDRQH